ncbi:MAG: hypothetical protein PHY16_19690 [Methylobacter sp.]|nr:hypothetical protein [Methylobacter sp.]
MDFQVRNNVFQALYFHGLGFGKLEGFFNLQLIGKLGLLCRVRHRQYSWRHSTSSLTSGKFHREADIFADAQGHRVDKGNPLREIAAAFHESH